MNHHVNSRILVSIFSILLITAAIAESEQSNTDDIHGLWIENNKRKVAVLLEDCGDLLCGRIYWLKKPLSANGQPKIDQHNPNSSLRNRPRCGLRILSGFVNENKNTWREGKIYNPSDGRTFSSTIKLQPDGSLKIRGYVGISLFGKTLKWVRPQEKLEQCN